MAWAKSRVEAPIGARMSSRNSQTGFSMIIRLSGVVRPCLATSFWKAVEVLRRASSGYSIRVTISLLWVASTLTLAPTLKSALSSQRPCIDRQGTVPPSKVLRVRAGDQNWFLAQAGDNRCACANVPVGRSRCPAVDGGRLGYY